MKNTKKKNGAAAKGKGRATLSAQQTIPYLSMHPDGVCKLPGGLYTKTVEYQNFHEGAATWCYFDEFHILLRDPLTASYFVAVWKMLRKKGCVPSALTQNVKDLLASREIENILDNTDFMILLSQAQSDRTILAKQLGISEHQLSYITHSNSGEGLLFYGNVTIPFVDRFPRGEIYDLLTTRPEDMKNETKNE